MFRATKTPVVRWSRALHLKSSGAADLLSKYVPSSVSVTESGSGGIPFTLLASRKLNVPVIEAKTPSGPAVLPLDILSPELPANTLAWIAQIGVPEYEREAVKSAVQGVWKAWRDNGLLRVGGQIHNGGKPVQISNVTAIADDFALSSYPSNRELENGDMIHPLERQAAEGGLFYHKNKAVGNIGCYGYGAGVAMSSMDALMTAGGIPANFLDGGGGATEANVQAAVNTVLADKDVKVFFINSFGGLTKMDLIAEGLVSNLVARKAKGEKIPRIVARLRGTGEEKAREILKAAAADLPEIEYVYDLKAAAEEAVKLSREAGGPAAPRFPDLQTNISQPVLFSQDGQYEKTLNNLKVQQGDSVMVLGLGKASQLNAKIASDWGTNIVGSAAPGKAGQTFLDKPVFGDVKTAVKELKPRIVSVFVPPAGAANAIIECIENEVPLVVAYAEGVPTQDQLRVQRALRSQSKTRVVGANCPGVIFPHERVKLGIQPLQCHKAGCVGIVSRSGTISYELAQQTSANGLGQSVVYGLGGDPFPSTRTWEALKLMLEDDKTRVVCLIGEVGGQMEEEAAEVYRQYLDALPKGATPKPVVSFIAGQATERGLIYGHAGAVWWAEEEQAAAKKARLASVGFVMADTLGDVGRLVEQEVARLDKMVVGTGV